MDHTSRNEEDIYYAALKEPPDGRSSYVKAACGDDLELLGGFAGAMSFSTARYRKFSPIFKGYLLPSHSLKLMRQENQIWSLKIKKRML